VHIALVAFFLHPGKQYCQRRTRIWRAVWKRIVGEEARTSGLPSSRRSRARTIKLERQCPRRRTIIPIEAGLIGSVDAGAS